MKNEKGIWNFDPVNNNGAVGTTENNPDVEE